MRGDKDGWREEEEEEEAKKSSLTYRRAAQGSPVLRACLVLWVMSVAEVK